MSKLPKAKRLPSNGARRYEQAHFIWNILSGLVLFKNQTTISYGELATILGYEPQAGRTLAEPLGLVSLYCLTNKLPPLSCIVVSKTTNAPGWDGMIPQGSTLDKEQKRVWNTKWHLYRTPSVNAFRKVKENADWSLGE